MQPLDPGSSLTDRRRHPIVRSDQIARQPVAIAAAREAARADNWIPVAAGVGAYALALLAFGGTCAAIFSLR